MKTCRRVLSMIVCLLLVLAMTASASITKVTKDASLTIYFNGTNVVCEDKEDNYVLPVYYEGSVHIPIYTMSRMVRRELKYDDEGKTIRATGQVLQGYEASKLSPPEDDKTLRKVHPELSKSSEVEAQIVKDVRVLATSNGREIANDADRQINLLKVDDTIYVPIHAMSNYLGLCCEWNSLWHGVDVMTTTFRDTVNEYINGTATRVPVIYNESRGVRDFIYMNYLQESPSLDYTFTIANSSTGKSECVVKREQFQKMVENRDKNLQEIDEIVESLKLDDLTVFQKAYTIANWIVAHYSYDQENMYAKPARSVDQVLATDKTVCEGFARLFMMMCRSAGIQCQYILGYVHPDGDETVAHAWNRVFTNDQWYYVDVTMGKCTTHVEKYFFLTEEQLVERNQEVSAKLGY